MTGLTPEERERAKDLVITMTDIKKCGLCAKGAREWFKRHNLSIDQMVTRGYPALTLVDQGDHLAVRVVRGALERNG